MRGARQTVWCLFILWALGATVTRLAESGVTSADGLMVLAVGFCLAFALDRILQVGGEMTDGQ